MKKWIGEESSTLSREASTRSALRLVHLLRSGGIDIRQALQRAQLTCPVDNFKPDTLAALSPDSLLQLISRLVYLLSVEANAQEGRSPARQEEWRMLFYCLISSRMLREAILRASEFFKILDGRWGQLTLNLRGDTAEIQIHTDWADKNVLSFGLEMIGLSTLHGVFSWLIAETLPATAIGMDYSDDMQSFFDDDLLPFPLELNAVKSSIFFPAKYLDYPILRAPEDFEQFRPSFLVNLREDESQIDLPERARRIIYRTLTDSQILLSLDELSIQLGHNKATVRRQLSEAGVSYNQIKHSCRRALGFDLLRRSTLSIEDISSRLCFCDSDAFRQAFHEWTGMSPSVYRNMKLQETQDAN